VITTSETNLDYIAQVYKGSGADLSQRLSQTDALQISQLFWQELLFFKRYKIADRVGFILSK